MRRLERRQADMSLERTLLATFGDGSVGCLTTDKAFTHAWRIKGFLRTGSPAEINGWARNEALAQQAARHHLLTVAKYWNNANFEVVEIRTG